MGCSLHQHWLHPHCWDCATANITGNHAPDFAAQLAERDAIIDELLVLLGQHLHPAFDERCIALRARVNALRNGETP